MRLQKSWPPKLAAPFPPSSGAGFYQWAGGSHFPQCNLPPCGFCNIFWLVLTRKAGRGAGGGIPVSGLWPFLILENRKLFDFSLGFSVSAQREKRPNSSNPLQHGAAAALTASPLGAQGSACPDTAAPGNVPARTQGKGWGFPSCANTLSCIAFEGGSSCSRAAT